MTCRWKIYFWNLIQDEAFIDDIKYTSSNRRILQIISSIHSILSRLKFIFRMSHKTWNWDLSFSC